MSPWEAYFLGLFTPFVAIGLFGLGMLGIALLENAGWAGHLSVYDDRTDHFRVIERKHASFGPFHWGRRRWWVRRPYDGSLGVQRAAWWVGVGRLGGRGVSIAKGHEINRKKHRR